MTRYYMSQSCKKHCLIIGTIALLADYQKKIRVIKFGSVTYLTK